MTPMQKISIWAGFGCLAWFAIAMLFVFGAIALTIR